MEAPREVQARAVQPDRTEAGTVGGLESDCCPPVLGVELSWGMIWILLA